MNLIESNPLIFIEYLPLEQLFSQNSSSKSSMSDGDAARLRDISFYHELSLIRK